MIFDDSFERSRRRWLYPAACKARPLAVTPVRLREDGSAQWLDIGMRTDPAPEPAQIDMSMKFQFGARAKRGRSEMVLSSGVLNGWLYPVTVPRATIPSNGGRPTHSGGRPSQVMAGTIPVWFIRSCAQCTAFGRATSPATGGRPAREGVRFSVRATSPGAGGRPPNCTKGRARVAKATGARCASRGCAQRGPGWWLPG